MPRPCHAIQSTYGQQKEPQYKMLHHVSHSEQLPCYLTIVKFTHWQRKLGFGEQISDGSSSYTVVFRRGLTPLLGWRLLQMFRRARRTLKRHCRRGHRRTSKSTLSVCYVRQRRGLARLGRSYTRRCRWVVFRRTCNLVNLEASPSFGTATYLRKRRHEHGPQAQANDEQG